MQIDVNNIEYSVKSQLAEYIGDVEIKSLFSGYGVFKHTVLFGLVINGEFYLYAVNKLANLLKSNDAKHCYDYYMPQTSMEVSHYYKPSKEITLNKALFLEVLTQSVYQSTKLVIHKQLLDRKFIRLLPGLNFRHEQMLKDNGIHTIQQLIQHGAINIYIRLKQNQQKVKVDFYWRLASSLKNRHVKFLTEKEKAKKLEKLNRVLAQKGMEIEKVPPCSRIN